MSSAGKNAVIAVLAVGIIAVLYVSSVQAETIDHQRLLILEMFDYIGSGCPR
jgi:hypothetical protein